MIRLTSVGHPVPIAGIFTEGSGADLAEAIELEIEDHDPMCFSVIKETEYLIYYFDAEEIEEVTNDDLLKINCENYSNSCYNPIFTIDVIEPIK